MSGILWGSAAAALSHTVSHGDGLSVTDVSMILQPLQQQLAARALRTAVVLQLYYSACRAL
jgi:hypothetical protein